MAFPEIKERPAECPTHGAFTQRCIHLYGEQEVWSRCPQCVAEQEARDAAQALAMETARAQANAEARLRNAGIPARFRDRTIDNYIAEDPEQDKAKGIAADFVANLKEHRRIGTSVVFSGNPGTGKSHLAIAILQHAMKDGTGMYLNAMDIVRMVRDTWRRDSDRSETEVLTSLGGMGLLVIDEVGVQYGTEGEQMVLLDVLNRRYRDCMPTIMLTNMKSAEFEQYIGIRAFDRLKEGGIWVRFGWDSYRGKK